jgi:hypothetical protein
MKWLVVISVLSVASLLLFNPRMAKAYECGNMVVDPPQGTPQTNFSLIATNCSPSPGDNLGLGYFDVLVIGPSGNEYYFAAQLLATTTVESQIGGLTENGSYSVILRYREGVNYVQNINSLSVQIQGGSSGPPGPGTTIACGSPCSQSSTCDFCPSFCPAVRRGNEATPFWTCGDSSALCQNTEYDSAGISSAVGCIPFEDINKTTEFFLRWALGVGGGVALFLIALSAIKIMTTRGDPKRVQDARDTLSAAIAGLVLILLSVFLVRFATEQLLALF